MFVRVKKIGRYEYLDLVETARAGGRHVLTTRPIFHRTDAAIRGHIFCTFLALVLWKELLDRLVARGGTMPEWQCIVDDLRDLSTVEVEQDGRRALLRTAPRPSIDPICRTIGLTLPPVYQEYQQSRQRKIPPETVVPKTRRVS